MGRAHPAKERYIDLNIGSQLLQNPDVREDVLRTASRLGYRTIAANVLITGRVGEELKPPSFDGKEHGQARSKMLAPRHADDLSEIPGWVCHGVRILTRVTVDLGGAARLDFLKSNEHILRRFDIIAVTPSQEAQLPLCCELDFVDIISLDVSCRLAFPIRQNFTDLLKNKSISLEVSYAPAIRDLALRRFVITNGAMIARAVRSGQLLVTSGAQTAMELRGGWDVANLVSVLFKMSITRAKDAVTACPTRVIARSASRMEPFQLSNVVVQAEPDATQDGGWQSGASNQVPVVSSDAVNRHEDRHRAPKRKKRKKSGGKAL